MIQHSFALRLDRERLPFKGRSREDRMRERFAPPDPRLDTYTLAPSHRLVLNDELERVAFHSPLTQGYEISAQPLKQCILDGSPLPPAFAWATTASPTDQTPAEEPRFIFAEAGEDVEDPDFNDFIVSGPGCTGGEEWISEALSEVVAHRRSRIFGLSLAHRIVNVMLPHATLAPMSSATSSGAVGSWVLQPLVTFIRDGRDHCDFSNTYALTCFLVPVDGGRGCGKRPITDREIERMVNAGWSLATSRPRKELPYFELGGQLLDYLSVLARQVLPMPKAEQEHPPQDRAHPSGPAMTLRQATETVAFGVALAVHQGMTGLTSPSARRRIADDVVTALGSARVSSVLVIDQNLTREDARKRAGAGNPPNPLGRLMTTLGRENRAPENPWSRKEHRRHRLDRPFVDDDSYVVGVLPHNRCLIIAGVGNAQHGVHESGLMQAGSAAYMAIGAASAIGTMRAMDRELERMEGENPKVIAEIDGEIAADLHDLYDLDITREAFRNLYGLLRDRLGINNDFETLQNRMESLYRATTTRDTVTSQRVLIVLTLAIVALSLVLVFKP